MRLIDADKLVKAIENENHGFSISGAEEKFAKIIQVNMQPTVEAIPKEWIINWLTKQTIPALHTCDDYDAVNMMLDDWEKENG